MHPNNLHHNGYNFKELQEVHPELSEFVFRNQFDNFSINFSKAEAVLQLNKALLKLHYKVTDWNIPPHYLCPPIPGRADYIHHINDILQSANISDEVKGLDIGVGANCIYPIIGSQLYGWKMVGADIDETAIASAKANVKATEALEKNVEIRHQENNANIFEGIIKDGEYYHFTICNPPFHASEKEASKGTLRKLKNLDPEKKFKELELNFSGQANELWCNGGEALFIKRMIKQSASFKTQVGIFTTLVSNNDHLNKFYKQLDKMKATHQTIKMEHGNKKSRILTWKFEG